MFRDFVNHFSEHGGYKRGQVKGVLSDMCSCIVEQLLEGKKVMLDELLRLLYIDQESSTSSLLYYEQFDKKPPVRQ